jgi:hypothetical protein
MLDDDTKPEQPHRARKYDRCNGCSQRITWIREDATGRYYPVIPGSTLRHSCLKKRSDDIKTSKERDGYI